LPGFSTTADIEHCRDLGFVSRVADGCVYALCCVAVTARGFPSEGDASSRNAEMLTGIDIERCQAVQEKEPVRDRTLLIAASVVVAGTRCGCFCPPPPHFPAALFSRI
jgi:hypothetical protein